VPVYKRPVFRQSSPKLDLILNINVLESSPSASPFPHLLHKPLRVVSSNTRDFYLFRYLPPVHLLVQVVLSRPVEALTLMYTTVATRPDITFAISTLSQFLNNPGCIHWEAVKHVFRYLAGTKTHALTYGNERHNLTSFTNANGSSQEHRHAISGYAFFIDGGAVSWASKKQELITLSTAEAEYVAATHAAKECIWLRRLMEPLFGPAPTPTTLYCDNQAALHLAAEDNYHARTKHIDIRYHFIRRTIADKQITMVYCPTEEMTADILTKALPKYKTAIHLQNLGIVQA